MKKEQRKYFAMGMLLLAAFALWTLIVVFVDVQAIGPENAKVGLGTLNKFVHDLTGVHMGLYVLTDWLSLVPLGFVAGFGCLGLTQWIRRKDLAQVDRSILVLGGFYVLVLAVFLFFETFVINYRPVLIEGMQEASYPSSTTLLVLCVMPASAMELRRRMTNPRGLTRMIAAFTYFMVLGRLLSGVHWLSDILGGGLLSAALVMLYAAMVLERK